MTNGMLGMVRCKMSPLLAFVDVAGEVAEAERAVPNEDDLLVERRHGCWTKL